jgi:hypothetical protein
MLLALNGANQISLWWDDGPALQTGLLFVGSLNLERTAFLLFKGII